MEIDTYLLMHETCQLSVWWTCQRYVFDLLKSSFLNDCNHPLWHKETSSKQRLTKLTLKNGLKMCFNLSLNHALRGNMHDNHKCIEGQNATFDAYFYLMFEILYSLLQCPIFFTFFTYPLDVSKLFDSYLLYPPLSVRTI